MPEDSLTDAPSVLPLVDAASYAGISIKALRGRIDRGTVRAVRRGGRVLVPVEELHRADLVRVGTRRQRVLDSSFADSPGQGEDQGTNAALLQLLREQRDDLVRQAEELGRLRTLTERSESTERELAAERASRELVELELHELRATLAQHQATTGSTRERRWWFSR